MKVKIFVAIVALTSVSVLQAQSQKGEKFQLVWADEFNNSGDPNSKFWTREVMASPPNNELEYYTSSAKNSFVKNGSLFIRTLKENLGSKNYTSARLITSQKIFWTYGRVEVRAKLPLGKGTWPAIWLLYNDDPYGGWPNSGEIDIMEHVGYDPGNIHGSAHGNVYNPLAGHAVKTSTYKVNNVADFHVYACEWNADSVKFFADGFNYYTVINEHLGWQKWPFNHDFFLILNNAFGGDWGGAQGVDNTIFKNDSSIQLEVDYVRLYKKLNDFSISGPLEVIENASNVKFSGHYYPNVKYNWIIPSGVSAQMRTDSSSILLNWGCSADSIGLQTSINNDTNISYYKVGIKNLTITGKQWVSENAQGVIYTADSVTGAKFKWTSESGIDIIGSDSTKNIAVNFTAEGKLFLKVTTACNSYSDTFEVKFGDGQFPYPDSSKPASIPGKIYAANFDTGGEGVAYHDTEAANQGGASRLSEGLDTQTNDGSIVLGWFNATEWVEYTVNIAKSGTYQAFVRVSNGGTSNGSFNLLLDNNLLAENVSVLPSGGWATFTTKTTGTFELPAGKHILKVLSNGGFNLGDMTFSEVTSVRNSNLSDWNIFPNPAKYIVNIKLKENIENANCQILSLEGKEILRFHLYKQTINTLQVNGLSKGVYLIRLTANNSSSTQKLIIE